MHNKKEYNYYANHSIAKLFTKNVPLLIELVIINFRLVLLFLINAPDMLNF